METKKSVFPTNHYHELKTDVVCEFSEPVITDQSYAKACDINNIMAQYAQTGMLPNRSDIQPQYIDNTQIPDLMTAFNVTRAATDAFMDLPPNIRRLMDNDPANLEYFIADPNNADVLLKHGLIIAPPSPDPINKGQGEPPENTPKT